VVVDGKVISHTQYESLERAFFGNIIKAQTDPNYTFDGMPRLKWLALHGLTETSKAELLPPEKEQ
jgi:hypothetical protein